MAPAQLTLSGQAWTAATPWAQAPAGDARPDLLLPPRHVHGRASRHGQRDDVAGLHLAPRDAGVAALDAAGRVPGHGAGGAARAGAAQRLGRIDRGRAAAAHPLAICVGFPALVADRAARADPADPRCRPQPGQRLVPAERQFGAAGVHRPLRALAAAGAQTSPRACSARSPHQGQQLGLAGGRGADPLPHERQPGGEHPRSLRWRQPHRYGAGQGKQGDGRGAWRPSANSGPS